jgi:hypothetical protein
MRSGAILFVMGEKEYQRPFRLTYICSFSSFPVFCSRRRRHFLGGMVISGDALTRVMFGPLTELIVTANPSPESAIVKFSGAMLGGMTLLE